MLAGLESEQSFDSPTAAEPEIHALRLEGSENLQDVADEHRSLLGKTRYGVQQSISGVAYRWEAGGYGKRRCDTTNRAARTR
jgi:hypothetical protein